MSVLGFDKPDRICIVDRNGSIVRLNDRNRTWCRFDACERKWARKILDALNLYPVTPTGLAPYRMLTLLGDVPNDMRTKPPCTARYYVMVFKDGLVYDRQWHDVEGFSVNTYIREMLSHGYGLDVRFMEFPE